MLQVDPKHGSTARGSQLQLDFEGSMQGSSSRTLPAQNFAKRTVWKGIPNTKPREETAVNPSCQHLGTWDTFPQVPASQVDTVLQNAYDYDVRTPGFKGVAIRHGLLSLAGFL